MGDRARLPEEPEGYLPLTPAVLDIMVALGNEEMHGYAIMQEVRGRPAGKSRLAPGTLYRSLRQMEERGWVAEAEERPEPSLDDERRRYYRLSRWSWNARFGWEAQRSGDRASSAAMPARPWRTAAAWAFCG